MKNFSQHVASESTHIALITLEEGNVLGSVGSLDASFAGPRHPDQGTVDTGGLEVALTGMEVGHEEYFDTPGLIGGSLLHIVDVQAVSGERGYKDFEDKKMSGYNRRSIVRETCRTTDFELCGLDT